MGRSDHKTLSRKRKLLGLTQHNVAQEANIPINRLVFAETGRVTLEQDELDRIRTVFRRRAQKAMAAVT
jgi:predicted transcriptional regulator